MEWSFRLPVQQYVHMVAGILQFGGITVAVLLAFGRTRGGRGIIARVYRAMVMAGAVAYPLLGAAYLLDRLGGVIEAVFFTGFSVIVLAELRERTSPARSQGAASASAGKVYRGDFGTDRAA